uniref:Uncharacterized protein n=1 Tax=Romanomermis culicivorax TaxID=13658 RepID=A0A915IMX9_ROMCU
YYITKLENLALSVSLDHHIIELRTYLKNEKSHLRLHPQDASAEVWSLDMAHPLWGMVGPGALKKYYEQLVLQDKGPLKLKKLLNKLFQQHRPIG